MQSGKVVDKWWMSSPKTFLVEISLISTTPLFGGKVVENSWYIFLVEIA
jgi:hypothetical protein